MEKSFSPALSDVETFNVGPDAPFLFHLPYPDGEKGAFVSADWISHADFHSHMPASDFILLSPIHAYKRGNELFIIDGHKRMQAAYRMGIPRIPALVYPESTPRIFICHLVFSNAMADRTLSGVEKTLAAYKSAFFMQHSPCRQKLPFRRIEVSEFGSEFVNLLGKLFGRKVSEDFILRCFEILLLELEELELLHVLNLPAEQILPLLDLERDERLWLLKTRLRVPVSAAQMRKLAELLIIARGRRNFNLQKWLDAAGETADDGKSLINKLRKEIHPELSAKEEKIFSYLKKAAFPEKIKIAPPENLEGNAFSCYFTFSNSKEFRRYINILQWAGGDGKIKTLLDELNPPSKE